MAGFRLQLVVWVPEGWSLLELAGWALAEPAGWPRAALLLSGVRAANRCRSEAPPARAAKSPWAAPVGPEPAQAPVEWPAHPERVESWQLEALPEPGLRGLVV